ncbi:hypothetical protein NIES4101_53290 [Calothrix sp. NIES-4101]|nr:hypothetical protein NIES4101_53290 [Calothrix sp. NIES-4101]
MQAMKLTEQMTFRTTPEIMEAVKRLSDKTNKTKAQIINELLASALGLENTSENKGEGEELKQIREMLIKHDEWITNAEKERQSLIKK